MKRNVIKVFFLFFIFLGMLPFSLAGQTPAYPGLSTASSPVSLLGGTQGMSLFQEALKLKKEGHLERALALFERALKASPEILSQNDEGLIEELRKCREREFALSPGNPKSMENLAYVYSVCLGEPRGILPFLKRGFEAAIDPLYHMNSVKHKTLLKP